jgi:cytochrome c556
MILLSKRIKTMIVILFACNLIVGCGSVSKEIEEKETKEDVSAGMNATEEMTPEVKDARGEDRVKFRREMAERIAENEKHLAEVKNTMAKANADAASQINQQWSSLDEKNKALKVKLESFNEALDTNWTIFSKNIETDLNVVSKSINDLNP